VIDFTRRLGIFFRIAQNRTPSRSQLVMSELNQNKINCYKQQSKHHFLGIIINKQELLIYVLEYKKPKPFVWSWWSCWRKGASVYQHHFHFTLSTSTQEHSTRCRSASSNQRDDNDVSRLGYPPTNQHGIVHPINI